MLNPFKMFKSLIKNNDIPTRNEMIAFLKTTPEAINDFERTYQNYQDTDDTDPFSTDARTEIDTTTASLTSCDQTIIDSITRDLIAITNNEPLSSKPITPEDLENIPLDERPQLTANAIQRDISSPSWEVLIHNLIKFQKTGDETYYHMFRQGLDILDLDPITYEILGCNQCSISHWFYALQDAIAMQTTLRVPETTIVKVPLPILQLSRLDYDKLNKSTLDIVNAWAMQAFNLDVTKDYFVKTGTYSSKFDFRNAHVIPSEVPELGSYLLFIQNQACEMAGPLTQPSIYGVSTTNEWCVREWIAPEPNTPTIYNGMPLRCEFRVFIDCDTDTILGISPYWREDVMRDRFLNATDADKPKQKHDYVIFETMRDKLESDYNNNLNTVIEAVTQLLPNLDLHGQWSLDIMLNGTDLWAIDMALAQNSALVDVVPENLLKPSQEDWIPKLPA